MNFFRYVFSYNLGQFIVYILQIFGLYFVKKINSSAILYFFSLNSRKNISHELSYSCFCTLTNLMLYQCLFLQYKRYNTMGIHNKLRV